MAINRIDCLSMTEFRETTVRSLAPDAAGRYPDGIHTLSGWETAPWWIRNAIPGRSG
jgi:hypothetical protein